MIGVQSRALKRLLCGSTLAHEIPSVVVNERLENRRHTRPAPVPLRSRLRDPSQELPISLPQIHCACAVSSAVTPNPAICGHFKTGQRRHSGTDPFYPIGTRFGNQFPFHFRPSWRRLIETGRRIGQRRDATRAPIPGPNPAEASHARLRGRSEAETPDRGGRKAINPGVAGAKPPRD
jgi:hypothetical protein